MRSGPPTQMPTATVHCIRHCFGSFRINSLLTTHIDRLPCVNAVVGIDLGTSNSAVAVVGSDGPLIISDSTGNASVPSVVAIKQDDELLVGHEAVQANAGPENTFYSFKRLLGQKASNVLEEAARVFYTVAEGDRSEALVYCPAVDDLLRPEELSGWVLRHLKHQAQQHLQESVTGAVITVPAHFNDKQKAATLDAAAEAGLPQVHLLQEPVAAALAYGIGGGTDGETVLVFDVGGGTYDVSVLQAFEGIMEVLGTGGDAHLGGDDFDAAITDWIMGELGSSSGGGVALDACCTREWAAAAAEAAKVALSCAPQAVIDAPGGRQLVLTEAKFVELTVHLFHRLAAPLADLGRGLFIEWAVLPEQAAALPVLCGTHHPDSGATNSSSGGGSDSSANSGGSSRGESGQPSSSPEDKWAPPPRLVTKVALVGQVTRLPAMQRFVRSVTGVQPCLSVDPGEAVALGAAIQAGVLLGSVGSVELMDGSFVGELHGKVTGFAEWQP